MEKLQLQQKNRKKRKLKKKKKQLKKKKKRHLRKVRAMEKPIKIKKYLLKEEETMAGIHITKGAKILENSSRAERQRILTAYKDLFSTN